MKSFGATFGSGVYPYASEKASITWPCYILDKYEAGLIDAYQLVGDQSARGLLVETIKGAVPHIPDHTYDRTPDSPKQAPYDEPYIFTFREPFQYLPTDGRQEVSRYGSALSARSRVVSIPLAQNRDLLPGKHAYSHMITFP